MVVRAALEGCKSKNVSGPKYATKQRFSNWGSQERSVYVAGERLKVSKPRIRSQGKEITLPIYGPHSQLHSPAKNVLSGLFGRKFIVHMYTYALKICFQKHSKMSIFLRQSEFRKRSYEALSDRSRFSQEILLKALSGISCRNYQGALDGLLEDFGISKSSVSRHLKEATLTQLKELQERSFQGVEPFAIFLDGSHIGSTVFIVGLLIDTHGKKHVLGFWEGATENHEICLELFNNLEDRGLLLTSEILFVIDGGKGVIKALKERFGKRAGLPAVHHPQRPQYPEPFAQKISTGSTSTFSQCDRLHKLL